MIYDKSLDDIFFIHRDDKLDFRKIKNTHDIDKFTEEYLNYVTENYNDFKRNQEIIKKRLLPSQIRNEDEGWYDYLVNDYLEPKEIENNEEKISVDKAMKHLEDAKQMLNEITNIIEDTKISINNKKVGTLQGITRQVIAENNNNDLLKQIKPDKNDVLAQSVLDQDYDELEHIKGGKNNRLIKTKKRKTNKKIIKKSRKTNKYKY
jgi:hypothetical protein